MAKLGYHIENVTVVERWSSKRQTEEIAGFQAQLNSLGSVEWELVSFESVPLTGRFSDKIKADAYLALLNRPASWQRLATFSSAPQKATGLAPGLAT